VEIANLGNEFFPYAQNDYAEVRISAENGSGKSLEQALSEAPSNPIKRDIMESNATRLPCIGEHYTFDPLSSDTTLKEDERLFIIGFIDATNNVLDYDIGVGTTLKNDGITTDALRSAQDDETKKIRT
jgi:hypothetical protein